jgi:hypothetical protein
MDIQELESLLSAVSHGWADAAETERLDRALRSSELLRNHAAEWLCNESLLRHEASLLPSIAANAAWSSTALADLRAESDPVVNKHKVWSLPLRYALAAALIIAAFLNVFFWGRSRDPSIASNENATSVRLTKVTGCVWDNPELSEVPYLGRSIKGGEQLRLLQGIAEIQVQTANVSGAVRLQGPCVVILRADGIPLLKSGRLVLDLNVYGKRCVVESPIGQIELSESASFGMFAGDDEFEVHVFAGDVRLRDLLVDLEIQKFNVPDVGPGELELLVHAGEAAIFQKLSRKGTQLKWITANSTVFAEELSMLSDQLSLTSDYADRVMASRPLSYWRFNDDSTHEFENLVAGGEPLRIGGEVATVVQGTNRALEFGMTRQSGYLYQEKAWPPAPLSELSVELWMKPSHFHNGAVFGLVSPNPADAEHDNHAMLIELGGPDQLVYTAALANSLRYLLRDPPSEDPAGECGRSVENVYQVRRWQHVVYVKHRDRVELFLDGKKIASEGCLGVVAAGQQIICGSLYPHRITRPFVGQLDEIAVYDRPLSEQEILTHFQLGSGATAPNDSI